MRAKWVKGKKGRGRREERFLPRHSPPPFSIFFRSRPNFSAVKQRNTENGQTETLASQAIFDRMWYGTAENIPWRPADNEDGVSLQLFFSFFLFLQSWTKLLRNVLSTYKFNRYIDTSTTQLPPPPPPLSVLVRC